MNLNIFNLKYHEEIYCGRGLQSNCPIGRGAQQWPMVLERIKFSGPQSAAKAAAAVKQKVREASSLEFICGFSLQLLIAETLPSVSGSGASGRLSGLLDCFVWVGPVRRTDWGIGKYNRNSLCNVFSLF